MIELTPKQVLDDLNETRQDIACFTSEAPDIAEISVSRVARWERDVDRAMRALVDVTRRLETAVWHLDFLATEAEHGVIAHEVNMNTGELLSREEHDARLARTIRGWLFVDELE